MTLTLMKKRNKILDGELEREECDEEDSCEFLIMLKRKNNAQIYNNNEIDEQEWRRVAKKAKNSSTSSAHSKRDYAVCKCTLFCDRIVEVLEKFYNLILRYNHCPERWIKAVDIMTEKGKGPKLGN